MVPQLGSWTAMDHTKPGGERPVLVSSVGWKNIGAGYPTAALDHEQRRKLWPGQGSFSEVGRLAPDDSFRSANLSPCALKLGTSFHRQIGRRRRSIAQCAIDVPSALST
jgi:hypothetical protein